jgi:hypothetical protein
MRAADASIGCVVVAVISVAVTILALGYAKDTFQKNFVAMCAAGGLVGGYIVTSIGSMFERHQSRVHPHEEHELLMTQRGAAVV